MQPTAYPELVEGAQAVGEVQKYSEPHRGERRKKKEERRKKKEEKKKDKL